jgi:predicted nuclease with TOPRIM domain
MTLPDERYRAVMETIRFLTDLQSSTVYPRVPKQVRKQALSLLRHYPSAWDMKQAAENCPNIFQERMEDVTRMFKQYEKTKAEKYES